ncbi:hypothetical protein Pelo_1920 [Pelomyxa schiedti]|nr:hypothetical protein Pelo_1920 [Pelomyxa schiedti]
MATHSESPEAVKYLLRNGVNFNTMDDISGLNALHIAVSSGNVEIATILVGAGADTNAYTRNGDAPLHLVWRRVDAPPLQCNSTLKPVTVAPCIMSGSTSRKRSLSDNPSTARKPVAPDPHKTSSPSQNQQPGSHYPQRCHSCVHSGGCAHAHVKMIELLLQHNGSTSCRSRRNGDTPLHCAARARCVAAVRLLLKCSVAEISTTNGDLDTPLHAAVRTACGGCCPCCSCAQCMQTFENLSFNTPSPIATCTTTTALHSSSSTSLLPPTFTTTSTSTQQQTTTTTALPKYLNSTLVATTEPTPIPPSTSIPTSTSPSIAAISDTIIHHHCTCCNIESATEHSSPDERKEHAIVQQLLLHGSKVNAVNAYMDTPLHLAAKLGHPSVVRLLLKHGADTTAGNQLGDTPLSLAAAMGHTKVCRILESQECKSQ